MEQLRTDGYLPPDSALLGSNVMSVPECALLAWMTAHYTLAFGSMVSTGAERVSACQEKGWAKEWRGKAALSEYRSKEYICLLKPNKQIFWASSRVLA